MNDISKSNYSKNKTVFDHIDQNKKQIWKYGLDTKKKTIIVINKKDSFRKKINFILKWLFGPISCSKTKIDALKAKTLTNLTSPVKKARSSSSQDNPPPQAPIAVTAPVSKKPLSPTKNLIHETPKDIPPFDENAAPATVIDAFKAEAEELQVPNAAPHTTQAHLSPVRPTVVAGPPSAAGLAPKQVHGQSYGAPATAPATATPAHIKTAVKMPEQVPTSAAPSSGSAPQDVSFFSHLFANSPAFKAALATRGIRSFEELVSGARADEIEKIMDECLPSIKNDLNKMNAKGCTLLYMALLPQSGVPANVVRKLIENGADIFAADKSGVTPFDLAFPGLSTPSQVHVVTKYLELEKDPSTLIPKGCRDKANRSLHSMALLPKAILSKADADSVKKLLDLLPAQAALARDQEGYTALHRAVMAENLPAVQLLISDRLKDLKTKDDEKNALHLAAEAGSVAILKTLAEAGLDINALDKNKNTALILAAAKGNLEAVRYLTALSANANLQNSEKKTALAVAREKSVTENDAAKKQIFEAITAYLRPQQITARPGIKGGAVLQAAKDAQVGTLKSLLAQGANPNETDEHGNTALMIAVIKKDAGMVRALLEASAEVNARNKDGIGALMLAGKGAEAEIVRLLLEKNPEIVFNKKGDRIEASHQDWVYECSSEIQEMIKSHVKKLSPPALFSRTTELQQGQLGNCFLLATLSALLSSPQNEHAVKSLFHRLPDGSLEVRVRHPHDLLKSARSAEQREELTKKYQYRFENGESVFTLDPLRQHIINSSELGVLSNSFGVKILERISHYIYEPSQRIDLGSLMPTLLDHLHTNIDFIKDFLERLMDVRVKYEPLGKHDQIKDLIPMLNSASDKALFVAMDDGASGHVWALKNISFNPRANQYEFHLVNPHNTAATELISEADIRKRRGLVGIVTPNDPENALVLAVKRRNTVAIKELLENGHSLDVRDVRGKSLFELAEGVKEIEELLTAWQAQLTENLSQAVQENDVNRTKHFLRLGAGLKNEAALLKMAIANQSMDMVNTLNNFVDSSGLTALKRAIVRGDLEHLKDQLRYRKDLHSKDKNGCHILHYAALSPNPAILNQLLAYVPDLIDVPINGERRWTALHIAVETANLPAVKMLLDAHANIDKKTEGQSQRTPLIMAVQNGHLELARLLVQGGADLTATNIGRKTALDFAQTDDMRAILGQSPGSSSTPSPSAQKALSASVQKSAAAPASRQYVTFSLEPHSTSEEFDTKKLDNIRAFLEPIANGEKRAALTKEQISELTSALVELLYFYGFKPKLDDSLQSTSLLPAFTSMTPASSTQEKRPLEKASLGKLMTNVYIDAPPKSSPALSITLEVDSGLTKHTYFGRDSAMAVAKALTSNPHGLAMSVVQKGRQILFIKTNDNAALDPDQQLQLALKYGAEEAVDDAINKGACIDVPLEGPKTANDILTESAHLPPEIKDKIQNSLESERTKRQAAFKNNSLADALLEHARNGSIEQIREVQKTLDLRDDTALLKWCIDHGFTDTLIALIDHLNYNLSGDHGLNLVRHALLASSNSSVAALKNKGAPLGFNEMLLVKGDLQEALSGQFYNEIGEAIQTENTIKVQQLLSFEPLRKRFFESNRFDVLKNGIQNENLKEVLEVAALQHTYSSQAGGILVAAVNRGNLVHVQKLLRFSDISDEQIAGALRHLHVGGMLRSRYYIVEALLRAIRSEPVLTQIGLVLNSSQESSALNSVLKLICSHARRNNDIDFLNRIQKPFGLNFEALSATAGPSLSDGLKFSLRSASISLADETVVGTYLTPHAGGTTRPPQSIIMLVDLSGSMGEVMVNGTLAKSVQALADTIPPYDTLTIVGFGTSSTTQFGNASCVNIVKDLDGHFESEIKRVCDNFKDLGGTNFKAAFAMPNIESVLPGKTRILFLTDGVPDSGTGNPSELIAAISKNLGEKVPVDYIGMTANCARGILEELREKTQGQGALIADQKDIEGAVAELLPYLCAERTPAGTAILKAPDGEEVASKAFYEMPIDNLEKRVVFTIPKERLTDGLYEITYVFNNGEEVSSKVDVSSGSYDPKLLLDFYDSKVQSAILSGKDHALIKDDLRPIQEAISGMANVPRELDSLKTTLLSTIDSFLNAKSVINLHSIVTSIGNQARSNAPSILPAFAAGNSRTP